MHRSDAPQGEMPSDGAFTAGRPTSGSLERHAMIVEEKCAASPAQMQPRHAAEPGSAEEIWNWYLAFSLDCASQTSIRDRVLLVGSDGAHPALLGKFVTVLPGNARGERAASDPPIPGLSEATRETLGCIVASLPRVRGILVVDSLEQDSLGAQPDALADGSRPVYVIVTSSKFKERPRATNAPDKCAHAPADRLCVTPAFSTPLHPDTSDVGRRLAELLETSVENGSRVAAPEDYVCPEPKDLFGRDEPLSNFCPSPEEID